MTPDYADAVLRLGGIGSFTILTVVGGAAALIVWSILFQWEGITGGFGGLAAARAERRGGISSGPTATISSTVRTDRPSAVILCARRSCASCTRRDM